MLQLIELYIPQEATLPAEIQHFSPEEKYWMIKIGSECLQRGREFVVQLTQEDLTQKMRTEMQKERSKLECELQMERETARRMEDQLKCLYEKELDTCQKRHDHAQEKMAQQLKQLELEIALEREIVAFKKTETNTALEKKIQLLEEQLAAYAQTLEQQVQQRLKNELDIQSMLLAEKDKQMEQTKQTYDAALVNYTLEIDQLNKKIQLMRDQMVQLEEKGDLTVQSKVEKARQQYQCLLEEKQKYVDQCRETYEKILLAANGTKSTSTKGSEGEKQFEEWADTFKDFKGFQIVDKHTQSGEGDFHLQFEDFSVLVDAKNYKKKVPIDQRDKIKKDLVKNEHIAFAWLVSLNTAIDKFDRAPIMFEWINTRQCVFYINHLCSFEDPAKVLRIAWSMCKELSSTMFHQGAEDGTQELVEMKEQRYRQQEKIAAMRKHIKEANTSLNTTKTIIQLIDDQLRSLLEAETKDIVEAHSLLDEWWSANMERTGVDEDVVSFTDIWFRFRQMNKDVLKSLDLNVDKFKTYLKNILPAQCLQFKSKHSNSTFTVRGYQLMELKL